MNLLNSKGNFASYIAVIVDLFVFIIGTFIGYVVFSSFDTGFQATSYYSGEVAAVSSGFNSAFLALDYISVIFMVLMIIGVGYTSLRINSHPAFLFIDIVMLPFLGVISYVLNSVFSSFVDNPNITPILALFPKSLIIGTNLHWIALICFVVGSIALYSKRRNEFEAVS